MIWIALALWTYKDSQSRSNNILVPILSTILVAATFFIGWLIYLMLRPSYTLEQVRLIKLRERESLAKASEVELCPRCKTRAQPEFKYCPICGLDLKSTCPNCRRSVRITWNICPYCGHQLEDLET
ncbi:hypothetical protein Tter_0681 [Thermobaculum terrenum ATCC BAA-798]|uniref:DZANK-type domain-containing protein n=1 Tax=Thermobaculum terrenum (strain ATCC BAA-798 / CCMEE 7001 / YNP1) TaxID=525904 RepID=D1CF92_THET1|nr:hypothetical protein Tter_0681 [Thermobaculum terrenum ATCC BAA-798]